MCDCLCRTREQSAGAGSVGVVERYSKSTISDSICLGMWVGSHLVSEFFCIILLIYVFSESKQERNLYDLMILHDLSSSKKQDSFIKFMLWLDDYHFLEYSSIIMSIINFKEWCWKFQKRKEKKREVLEKKR